MEHIQDIYRWGIDIIKAIQTIENPMLTAVILFVTNLGAGVLYVLMLLYIFWCVDDKAGMRLSVLTVFSVWANGFLKIMLKQPRPYNLDPSIGRAVESSYGIPSGHAQSALVFFMSIAFWLKKPVFYVTAILVTLLMSFTRLYLGVHFPTDILAAWIAGCIILALYWFFAERIIAVLNVSSIRFRLIVSAAISFIMLLLNQEALEMPGVFLGLGMGYTLMLRFFPFDVTKKKAGLSVTPVILIARYALGLACTGVLLFLGSNLIDTIDNHSSYYRIIAFLFYAFIGAFVSAGVPWLFLKLGLSVKKE
jgi:membrane-associated phospholipid phosphatase